MTFATRIAPSVLAALRAGDPVVALESTVITHGLPYPDNLKTARLMEAAVRQGGALPATIAILGGEVVIGLDDDELTYLAEMASSGTVRKVSRRDLPIAASCGEDGGTTVAGTMILAHRAGIEFFATGGIGGVHRGHVFDISADLRELGQTPLTVICSGAKSILDLAATREVLETEGVTVVGYRTDTLPAFFTPSSGLPVDVRLEDSTSVARLVDARRALGLQSSTLVTVPIPDEFAIDQEQADAAVAQATQEMDALGIQGPACTPWLLQRVLELTEGSSMQANVALLQNNGRVAAEIAVALSQMRTPA